MTGSSGEKSSREISTKLDAPATKDVQPSETSEIFVHPGRMNLGNTETTWVENEHWTAILDGVAELKESLKDASGDSVDGGIPSNMQHATGPELFRGDNMHIERKELLAAIPPRPVADRYVSQVLKPVDAAPMILHIPTFLAEYERFWSQQEQTSVLWLGLLFAIMCLAVLQQHSGFEAHSADEVEKSGTLATKYRTRTTQCLFYGNYTKPAPYLIEALVLYMHVEYLQSKDSETGLWILLGITVRMALRMGYHRDASHFPGISPFHAEMRRRVWCVLCTMDAGSAAQFGLPRMICISQSNAREPRSLLDEDLQRDMRELPPPRPDSIQTPIQYFVAKNKLISVSGKISDLKLLTKTPQYDEILELDRLLHSTRDGIPQILAMRPMSKSIMDDPVIIVQRMYLALVFYKAKCLLHQKYLILARTDDRYMYSRTACIEAALEILHIQQALDQEAQPGGRLYADRVKVTSVMRSDFLLGATILCVDLYHTMTHESMSTLQQDARVSGTREKIYKALTDAHLIWQQASNSSQEAHQAVQVLSVVLEKAAATKQSSSAVSVMATMDSNPKPPAFGARFERASEQSGVGNIPLINYGTLAAAYVPGNDAEGFLDFPPMDFEMVSTRSVDGVWR